MAAGAFVRLVPRRAEDVYTEAWGTATTDHVMVEFRHVCQERPGVLEEIQFSWHGDERGGPFRCGCWAAVPHEEWTHGKARQVWEAVTRLKIREE